MRVSDPIVVNLELVHTVDIGDLEFGLVESTGLSVKGDPHKGVNPDKLELDVGGIIWLPVVVDQLLNFDGVDLEKETII